MKLVKDFQVSWKDTLVYCLNVVALSGCVSRVTGQNRSDIFGTLGIFNAADVISNPNLLLMNPNGIVFGKNASLDMQASFVGTTANAIAFANQ